MKIDGVFSGGGVKAFAFVGCLESLKQHQLTLERVAGTSAGAIIATLIAAGYEFEEITTLIDELNLKQLLDPPPLTSYLPFTKWIYLYYKMGLNKGERLEQWISEQLAKKGVYTFKDIKANYLKVVATDLTYSRLVIIPDDLQQFYNIDPNQFPVATAVRMSAGFPYFFMPKQLRRSSHEICLFVDGGLLSNFPLWIFNRGKRRKKRPVLGMKLSDHEAPIKQQKINNSFALLQAILSTMKKGHENRYMSIDQQNIIYIPTGHLSPVDFNIDKKIRDDLIQRGKTTTDEFLKHWP